MLSVIQKPYLRTTNGIDQKKKKPRCIDGTEKTNGEKNDYSRLLPKSLWTPPFRRRLPDDYTPTARKYYSGAVRRCTTTRLYPVRRKNAIETTGGENRQMSRVSPGALLRENRIAFIGGHIHRRAPDDDLENVRNIHNYVDIRYRYRVIG